MKCEHCLPQMLPFVYDLLEADERSSVSAHLEDCPSCQEALRGARAQAGLLAEAVKDPTSDLVFRAPAQHSALSSAPTVAMPRPPRRSFLLNRWSVAAGLLLAFFSVGGVIGWNIWRESAVRLDEAHDRLAKAKGNLAKSQQDWSQQKGQTQKEIRAIQEQINQLFNDWRAEENKKRKFEQDRVQLLVNGPQVAQAGANNNYQVQMFQQQDARGAVSNVAQAPGLAFKGQQQPPALPNQALNVRAFNQKTQKTLFEQNLITQQDGTANFILPSDIPFKPGDDIVLVFETRSPTGKLVKLDDSLKLVFPEYVTHLATDRPLYRPGETVRFRSLTLERFSLKPAQQALHLRYRVVGPHGVEIFQEDVASQRLTDRNLEPIKGVRGEPVHGIGVGAFALPADLSAGQYTLFVNEVNDRFHEEKRTFLVHSWQASRLSKEVQFQRTSYGAGDLVRVQLKVVPVQGLAPAGMRGSVQVSAVAVVDGENIPLTNPQNNITDENGIIAYTFTLPAQMHKGVGNIQFFCDDAGIKETIRRTIPIVVNNLELDFYPEGGDLIADVPNRVYFQARTPANRPADVEASIFDEKNQVVARIKTMTDDDEPGINQGLGSFIFTPRAKGRYTVRIDSPIGIDRTYPLPLVRDKGLVMTIPQGVVADEIDVTLHSAKQARELLVGAYCRGRMLDHQFVHAVADTPTAVTLKPQAGVGGVFRITVFEKLMVAGNLVYRPLAERLIYRKNAAKVEILVEANQRFYQPGESVALSLRALNEKKELVPAYAMIAVVDQSVLKLADEKTARTMPTHFLLTTEVRNPEDLENADVLLGTHPKAAQALDLLLGCQGWRRFAEQNPEVFQRRLQQAKLPAFLANANPVSHSLDAEQRQIDKLDQPFVAKAIELEKALAVKEKQEVELPQAQLKVTQQEQSVQAAEQAQFQSEQRQRDLSLFYVQFLMGGALLTLLFIGFCLVSVGLRRLAEGEQARNWLVIGIALLGLLFVISVAGTFLFMGEHLLDRGPGGMAALVAKNATPAAPVVIGMAPIPGPLEDVPDDVPESEPAAPVAERQVRADKNGAPPAPDNLAANNLPINKPNFNPHQDWQRHEGKKAELGINADERELRQQGKYQALLQNKLGRRVQLPSVDDPCVVREYAHQHKPRGADPRRDFAETLYWHPILVLPDGTADIKFDLSDAVTRFQVLVFSHAADGRLGANRTEIISRLPFSIDPKTPIEVTNTDKITVPVALGNPRPQPNEATLSARARGLTLEGLPDRRVALAPNQNLRELFKVEPSIVEGTAVLRFSGRTKNASDVVERRFKIVPEGFPITGSVSGILENGSAEHTITLPEEWLPGSLQLQANFYPSPIAELQGALEALKAEPINCFEQNASSTYLNVLILNHMKAAGQINVNFQPNPTLEKQVRQRLQAGYQRLLGFECIDPQKPDIKRGYEWFGGTAPADDALTAHALLQFRDLAKILPVDVAMVKRTEQYLLDQRDRKGGFKRNSMSLERAPDSVTNAYILWALSTSGTKENLNPELAAVRASCKGSKDPYLLALAALGHAHYGKMPDGVDLLRELAGLQKPDGELTGATASITGSQGRDLLVESTALAILGWLKVDRGEFTPNVNKAVKWLGQQRRGAGGFGSTQATALALKALIAHAEKFPRATHGGEVSMVVRDTRAPGVLPVNNFAAPPRRQVGAALPEASRAFFSPRSHDPITLSLRDASVLSPGKNVIQLSIQGQSTLPYVLTWSYRTPKRANDSKAPIRLKTTFNKEVANEGDIVKLNTLVHNMSGKDQGMALAIIGLPGGLALPEDFAQLKSYAKPQGGATSGKIGAWELRGRELVLYWRDLPAGAKMEVELDLICRLPGSYRGAPSRAYLYYDPDRKDWIEPLRIQIGAVP